MKREIPCRREKSESDRRRRTAPKGLYDAQRQAQLPHGRSPGEGQPGLGFTAKEIGGRQRGVIQSRRCRQEIRCPPTAATCSASLIAAGSAFATASTNSRSDNGNRGVTGARRIHKWFGEERDPTATNAQTTCMRAAEGARPSTPPRRAATFSPERRCKLQSLDSVHTAEPRQ